MIKNIVFDLGNVLTSFHPEEYFLAYFKDRAKSEDICAKIFQDHAWQLYDQGIYLMEDLYRVYLQAYPDDEEEICYVLQNWLHILQLMPASFAYMKQLKREGYHIYILSNLSKDSADYLKDTESFFSYAEGAVLSYEEKLIKPDPAIYQVLLKRYQLEPKETIFLDDSAANIAQAKRSGIHGIVFQNIEQVKRDVQEIIRRTQVC